VKLSKLSKVVLLEANVSKRSSSFVERRCGN